MSRIIAAAPQRRGVPAALGRAIPCHATSSASTSARPTAPSPTSTWRSRRARWSRRDPRLSRCRNSSPPATFANAPLLPSFLYLPGEHDLPPGSTALPWDAHAATPSASSPATTAARCRPARHLGEVVAVPRRRRSLRAAVALERPARRAAPLARRGLDALPAPPRRGVELRHGEGRARQARLEKQPSS